MTPADKKGISTPPPDGNRGRDNPPGDREFMIIRRPKANRVLAGARLLRRGNPGLTEVRVIVHERGVILAGYFTSTKAMVKSLTEHADQLGDANVFATLNPVKRSLLTRAPNHLRRLKTLTKDSDILSRRWFPIDVDPVRPGGVSATDEELHAARRKRDEVVAYLRGLGWPAPVLAVSGNGAHALYQLDLPNTPDVTALIERALRALDTRFSDSVAKVDTAVGNASRVWKLYGTWARKGASTKARSHRRSYIETDPGVVTPVSRERLRQLAEHTPVATGLLAQPEWPILAVVQARGWLRGTKARGQYCIECPWRDQHTTDGGPSEAMLFEPSPENGNRGGFKCFHDHCAKRTIEDLVALAAPDTVRLLCMADIPAEAVHWLWYPWIPLGKLTMVEGDPGLGKSHLVLRIATALSHGDGLPGMTRTAPANTLLLTAEDGLGDTVRPRLDSMGADLSRVFPLDGPMVFDAAGLAHLEQAIQRTNARLVVVDPLVAYLGSKVDLHRATETRAFMKQLATIAERHSCAILLVRHLTKSGKDHPIYRGLGSIDLTASSRSVMLVGSDPNDDTRAVLLHIKSNLARKADSQGFTIANGVFRWTGRTTLTAGDVLGAEQRGQSAVQPAVKFLQQALSYRPAPAKAVRTSALAAGISEKTLRRARELLGVIPEQVHEEGRKGAARFTWRLPEVERSTTPQGPVISPDPNSGPEAGLGKAVPAPEAVQSPTRDQGQVNTPEPGSGPKDEVGFHLPKPDGEPGEGQVKGA